MTDLQGWFEFGAALSLAGGVHAPSRFSALLAASLVDCGGLTVIDAGCGAGLITIAALRAGAARVIAVDSDPAAVEVTRRNVAETVGTQRLEARQLDFRELGGIDADLLAVNPPQRPAATLDAVELDQRHLHEGGGPDGLDTLRLVLKHTSAAIVRTTAADILPIHTVGAESARRVLTATLPMHPAWHPLTGPEAAVNVWDLHLATPAPRRPGRPPRP
ncbi:50S ribosomal protein L11 methyltransferase [Paractinoplanes lichenicola]|uniref:50S ribosomal protein L11 methyltransferase n=1 Tax=Paractinoplanes lichenicola TaxID=2802976 RepID=A0ABS1VYX3_9ACTN|nr:50S ribosomal protein L11 methyltransferase [Actinoplanes lichenicola]MBL7259685.1 50S ribosomal protein L11 methyltransferase [Actinoplanes lichenicola]